MIPGTQNLLLPLATLIYLFYFSSLALKEKEQKKKKKNQKEKESLAGELGNVLATFMKHIGGEEVETIGWVKLSR